MSRHRFDPKVDRSDDTKAMSTPARLRRVEVITGIERRRKWSPEENAEIVAESFAEGAVVSEVARLHGLNPQQLFGWRAQLRDGVAVSDPSSRRSLWTSESRRTPLPRSYRRHRRERSSAHPQGLQHRQHADPRGDAISARRSAWPRTRTRI